MNICKIHYLCGMILSSTMKNTDFPTITTVEQAEPWEEGHVARIASSCFKTRFCKRLISSTLPPPVEDNYKLVSHCKPAAYTILPPKACTLSGGIFCALLLGLMLCFSACSKPETENSAPKQGGGAAPNQGVSFEIDTNWSGDTTIFIDPIAP